MKLTKKDYEKLCKYLKRSDFRKKQINSMVRYKFDFEVVAKTFMVEIPIIEEITGKKYKPKKVKKTKPYIHKPIPKETKQHISFFEIITRKEVVKNETIACSDAKAQKYRFQKWMEPFFDNINPNIAPDWFIEYYQKYLKGSCTAIERNMLVGYGMSRNWQWLATTFANV